MVSTDYLLSKALEIGNAAKTSKSGVKSRDKDDNFKSMLDKNVQKADEKDTKQTDGDTQKTETTKEPESTKPKDEATEPKTEDGAENLDENVALEAMVQQCAMANEQKLTLNWAEEAPVQEQSAQTAVQGVETQQLAADQTQNVQTQQQTAPTQTAEPQVQTAKQEAAAAQLTQENQPKQETQSAVLTTAAEGQAEAKDVQVTVQKGAESQNADDGQQTNLKEQGATDGADAAALQRTVTKGEETVLVKVGETLQPAEPKAADQLADSVLVKVQENTNEYELQLSPQELGKIKIKLVLEDGRISISMFCENQKAADLLGLTSARLKGIIEERTGSEAYVEVQKEDANPYSEQEKENSNSRGYDESRRQDKKHDNAADFMQQLRLGLIDLE